LAQSVVPALLDPDNQEIQVWKKEMRQTLELQSDFLHHQLSNVPGLQVMKTGGAMYTLIRLRLQDFDDTIISSDIDFCQRLLEEENVFMLPGSCFGVANVVRAVFCAPVDVLDQAATRIREFCGRHTR
jgi:tyrosine aminotransferase